MVSRPDKLRRCIRVAKIAAAVAVLCFLYATIDWRAVVDALVRVDPRWLAASLILFAPQTIVSAWRWQRWLAPVARIPLASSVRHTLAASALNLVVPSKLGDLSKVAMVPVAEQGGRRRLGVRAVGEKLTDVATLAAIAVCGAAVTDVRFLYVIVAVAVVMIATSITASRSRFSTPARGVIELIAFTMLLWTLHLLQIHWFMRAAGADVPWIAATTRLPLAIFAGLLPVSFCGFGTRDAALVWLFTDVASAPQMAVVGLLTGLRYLIPGLAGIPCLLALGTDASAAPQESPDVRQAIDHKPLFATDHL